MGDYLALKGVNVAMSMWKCNGPSELIVHFVVFPMAVFVSQFPVLNTHTHSHNLFLFWHITLLRRSLPLAHLRRLPVNALGLPLNSLSRAEEFPSQTAGRVLGAGEAREGHLKEPEKVHSSETPSTVSHSTSHSLSLTQIHTCIQMKNISALYCWCNKCPN